MIRGVEEGVRILQIRDLILLTTFFNHHLHHHHHHYHYLTGMRGGRKEGRGGVR